ncbi:FAD-dependent oxidoreductase [Massilia cavernae]
MLKSDMADLFPPSDRADDPAPTTVDIESRRHQMFPVLGNDDIQRLVRFGTRRQWADGELIFQAGQSSLGMLTVVSGRVALSRCDGLGNSAPITEIGPGEFSAEVAQLSGRPALVNGHAVGDVDLLVIDPEALRALVVTEADLGERIMRALILRRVGLIDGSAGGPILVGAPGNAAMFRLQSFLSRNGHPHSLRDPETDAQAVALVARYQPRPEEWPLVVCPDGSIRKNPSLLELGRCLGMLPDLSTNTLFDLLVVGAGPAGLATAVYAASEGLSVLVVEQYAYGGQAGASARIENYLGFPTGISGRALAGRSYMQAQKFGAEIAIPATAARLWCEQSPFRLTLSDDTALRARTVVLACGARYRRPAWDQLSLYEGRGVYYWASPLEAKLCRGAEVVVVGGGNSAGQAAVFLSGHASRVHIVIRGATLAASMSSYLVERIAATTNILLHTHTEIIALEGDASGLSGVQWRNRATGMEEQRAMRWVFLFVGADSNTEWLRDCGVAVDNDGFVLTGPDVQGHAGPIARSSLETSVPGIFAIGDVRAGSTKRVAAAVGEGAAVVAQVHTYLATLTPQR